jgi:class III poly(R)-hydroxyalkanoic acid synthase PhaE subunit
MPGGNSIPWGEQVETMAKAWTDAQKKMWENWYELAQTAPAPSFTSDWAGQWRKIATQGFEAWAASAEPTAKEAAERLFASQNALMRFWEFSFNVWKAMATKIEVGEDWQSVLKENTEQLRQQLLQSPEAMRQVSHDMTELWQLYLEELNKLAQPWVKSSQIARGHLGQAITGNGSALIDLTNLYWDAYERTFGRLVESPSLGYTRELNEKLLKGFDVWQDFRRVSFEYQTVLANTWIKAFEKLMKELVVLAEKGQPIQSVRQLVLLWNNVADPVFIEVFRSEKYIRIQGQLLNTAMAYRIHRREILELVLKILDMPTRSEVDEAHRSLYEQRKELKALKKTVAETGSMRAELAEAQRNIAELRQEVKALQEALAQVTARQNRQPESAAPAKPKLTAKTGQSPAKNKRLKTNKAAETIADNSDKGGDDAIVSHSNSA